MTQPVAALRMTVHISENDQHHHRPLYAEIVHRAHAAGLAGATVIRGCEGYGASSRIHTSRLLSLTEDLPVMIVVIDRPEAVRAFLPEVAAIAGHGLITLDEVEAYGLARPGAGPGPGQSSPPGGRS